MDTNLLKIKKAVRITGQTLLGSRNCCDVETEDGSNYRVVNFYAEHLESLIAIYPIKIAILSERIAVVHDERIPDEMYRNTFCEVCCPYEFWSTPQKMRLERSKIRDANPTLLLSNKSYVPEKIATNVTIEIDELEVFYSDSAMKEIDEITR